MAGEHTLAEQKGHTLMHTYIPPNQSPYQVSSFYILWNPRNSPDKINETHGHYEKVKGQIKVTP